MYAIEAVYFRVVSQRKKKLWERLMMPAVPYMLPFIYIEETPTMESSAVSQPTIKTNVPLVVIFIII